MSKSYEALSRPPIDALKPITGGRLNGKTDINPQWRYEAMDKEFGACGFGWTYEIIRLWEVPSSDGQIMCFSEIKVYTHNGSEWSRPIPGIGGSMLVVKESSGLHVSDEGYKMATTDALSVALKLLGVGADIYRGNWDRTKYRVNPESEFVKLQSQLLDWIHATPRVFTDDQIKYAENAINTHDLAAMRTAIAKAIEKSKKMEEQT